MFMLIDRAKSSLLASCGISSTKDIRDDLLEDAPSISEALDSLKSRA